MTLISDSQTFNGSADSFLAAADILDTNFDFAFRASFGFFVDTGFSKPAVDLTTALSIFVSHTRTFSAVSRQLSAKDVFVFFSEDTERFDSHIVVVTLDGFRNADGFGAAVGIAVLLTNLDVTLRVTSRFGQVSLTSALSDHTALGFRTIGLSQFRSNRNFNLFFASVAFNHIRSLSSILVANTLVDESFTFLFDARDLSAAAVQIFGTALDITWLTRFRLSTAGISLRLVGGNLRSTLASLSSFANSNMTFFRHTVVDNIPRLTFEDFFAHIVGTFDGEFDVNARRTADTGLHLSFGRISLFLTFGVASQRRTFVEVGRASAFQLSAAVVDLFEVRFLIEGAAFGGVGVAGDVSAGVGDAFIVEAAVVHLVRHQVLVEVTLRNFRAISVKALNFISIATRTDSTSVAFVVPRFTSDSRTSLVHTGVFVFGDFG